MRLTLLLALACAPAFCQETPGAAPDHANQPLIDNLNRTLSQAMNSPDSPAAIVVKPAGGIRLATPFCSIPLLRAGIGNTVPMPGAVPRQPVPAPAAPGQAAPAPAQAAPAPGNPEGSGNPDAGSKPGAPAQLWSNPSGRRLTDRMPVANPAPACPAVVRTVPAPAAAPATAP